MGREVDSRREEAGREVDRRDDLTPSEVVRREISRADRDLERPERVREDGRDTSRIDLDRAKEVEGTDWRRDELNGVRPEEER